MGNSLIALMVAAGASLWVYGKIMRSSGNNTKNAVIVAITAGAIIFIVLLMVLKLIPSA